MDGTGMGLLISKQLIELHLGSISIANYPEGGASEVSIHQVSPWVHFINLLSANYADGKTIMAVVTASIIAGSSGIFIKYLQLPPLICLFRVSIPLVVVS